MDRMVDHSGATALLGKLALNPKSTLATEELARASLALVAASGAQ